jgi:hypothetical protein
MDDEFDEVEEAEANNNDDDVDAISAATDFIAFLERCQNGPKPSSTRLPHFWHRQIQRWSADHLREAVRLAERNATVELLTVEASPEFNVNGASRIACVLRSFRNAREFVLRMAPNPPGPRRGYAYPTSDAVDALLHGMSGCEAHLRAIKLAECGGANETCNFLDRFPTLSTIELGEKDAPPLVMASDLAASLASFWLSRRETNLEHVSLRCRANNALDVARLLHPLGRCHRLRVLDVAISDPVTLVDVALVCAASQSIEHLAVAWCVRRDVAVLDATPLLWFRREFPESLRSLALRNFWLRSPGGDEFGGFRPPSRRRSAMWRVKSLDLVACGAVPLRLVLEWMPNLERLATGVPERGPGGRRPAPCKIADAELDAIARALPGTNVNDLSLHLRSPQHLPSLVALLRNAKGSIDLTFHRFVWTNVDSVRRGLEAMGPAVTKVGLHFLECDVGDADYARFLQVLGGRPSALESLTMQLSGGATDLRQTCDSVRAMLPSSSLQELELLQVDASRTDPFESSECRFPIRTTASLPFLLRPWQGFTRCCSRTGRCESSEVDNLIFRIPWSTRSNSCSSRTGSGGASCWTRRRPPDCGPGSWKSFRRPARPTLCSTTCGPPKRGSCAVRTGDLTL